MQRAIETIQRERKPEDIRRQIRRFQEMAKVEREMATKGKELSERMRAGRQLVRNGEYKLYCLKCDSFAVSSVNMRTIENSHRVILDSK